MRTFGLIGYPLSHSFSQGYFTEKFKKEKIDARYLNFPIASISEFKGLLEQHPYLAGLNVTIPYKEQVIPFLDELDEEAGLIGAVNVIKISWNNNKPFLKGFNSDVTGFFNSLTPLIKPEHTKALILGTGGASKAVSHALLKAGILYRFVSRTPKAPSHVSYDSLTPEIISEYKIIINTSPIGMHPNTEEAPDIPYESITENHLVYDLIYNPETTLFMEKAAEKGATIKNGLEMLHLQAEEAWRIWNMD
ncbi:shikimate dehydrogenase family protein [Alkalitalea saponilacus]|uniref:Shikimate dehydrogenase n=1 Tax=Alkalitalea saponilacus TaxID=889453 RepID=A0A1T5HCC0_9BACT|nr:shikimate dehydrogenase [Alkalitalea saponilacus]ASB50751.1 shikimate dehydrogenase [Alkalitalea saponilacus]SKC18355.1 shikimate dehydrogenase [Alkalitalea saponilacus]